jgi:hypothetical protein
MKGTKMGPTKGTKHAKSFAAKRVTAAATGESLLSLQTCWNQDASEK